MLFGAIKCNMDGLMRGSPGHAIVEGIFRDHLGGMLAYFSLNVGIQSTFFVEIFGAIIALEMTKEKGWNRTWLECDFTLVIHAFKKPSIVPWQVRYRWKNCLSFCKHIVFFFSLISLEKLILMHTNLFLLVFHLGLQLFGWTPYFPLSKRSSLENRQSS